MDKYKNMYKSGFGKRLKEARESRKLTQAEMAQKGGFTQGVIGRLERGGIDNPGKRTLETIYSKDVLDLTCDEIYNLNRDIAFEEEKKTHITTEDERKRGFSEHPKWESWDIKMSIPEQWFINKRTSYEVLDYLLPRFNEEQLNKIAALAYAIYNIPIDEYRMQELDNIVSKTKNSLVDKTYNDLAVLVYFDDVTRSDDEYIIEKGSQLLMNTLGEHIDYYEISSYNYEKSIIRGFIDMQGINDKLIDNLNELSKQQEELINDYLKEVTHDKLEGAYRIRPFNLKNIKLICSREEFNEYPNGYREDGFEAKNIDLGVFDTAWLDRFVKSEYDYMINKEEKHYIFNHYALVKFKVKYIKDGELFRVI